MKMPRGSPCLSRPKVWARGAQYCWVYIAELTATMIMPAVAARPELSVSGFVRASAIALSTSPCGSLAIGQVDLFCLHQAAKLLKACWNPDAWDSAPAM